MSEREQDEAARLAAYWDQLIQGHAAPAVDCDPAMAEAVRRLRAFQSALAPDPAFRARLQTEFTMRAPRPPLTLLPPAASTATAAPPAKGVRPWRAGSAPPFAATAALVLLLLGLGVAAFRPEMTSRPTRSASVATPATTRTAAPLLRVTLPAAWTRGVAWIGVDRATYAPGGYSRDQSPASPQLYFIESGVFTVHAMAGSPPVRIAAGAAIPPTADARAGADLRLGPGDALLLPAGSTVEVRNDGSTSATLLWLLSNQSDAAAESAGMTSDDLDLYTVNRLVSGAVPPPPILVVLQRAELAPGAALPAPAETLTAFGAVDPAVLVQGAALVADRENMVRNAESTPLAVYVLTAAPANGSQWTAIPPA